MRKDSKRENAATRRGNLQGYHQGGYGENYAFTGFVAPRYYTSDRFIPCDNEFRRLDGKAMKGYGLEIETDFILSTQRNRQAQAILANIMQTAIFPLFPEGLFKQQEDCTITGTECITQVMTKEFIRNNYKNFKTMWNERFAMFGITTGGGRCGMHVNISVGCLGTTPKIQEESTRKLFYIINKHYDLFKAAFYRVGSTDWCGRMDYSNAKNMDVHNMPSSHGNCFNGSHFDAGRVEIRLVGGQKNFACFRNTMETVFHIVDKVKSLSWKQCDDITAIFSGCNNYVFNRLRTYCFDAGAISLEQLNEIEQTVQDVMYI